jgi:hypothetical protein
MSPPQRAEHWQSLRIFFVTPQVLEKDIQSGMFSNSLFLLYIYCWRLTRNMIATVKEHNCVWLKGKWQEFVQWRRLCAWWLMKPIEQLAITHTVWSFVRCIPHNLHFFFSIVWMRMSAADSCFSLVHKVEDSAFPFHTEMPSHTYSYAQAVSQQLLVEPKVFLRLMSECSRKRRPEWLIL